jgi:Ca2+:H+ antiporter
MFTLRTHAAVIWTTELDEKKTGLDTVNASQTIDGDGHNATRQNAARTDIRDSQLYQRILGQSLRQAGLISPNATDSTKVIVGADGQTQRPSSVKSPHIVPPKGRDGDIPGFHLQALSEEDNNTLTRTVAEIAAKAAAAAARDAAKFPHKVSKQAQPPTRHEPSTGVRSHPPVAAVHDDGGVLQESGVHDSGGGHDAPNWSKMKSAVILLVATLAYAVIAEILVDTVDAVLNNVDIDEKFLGITLFALVPNTTEFLVRLPPFRFLPNPGLCVLTKSLKYRTPYPSQ